MADEGSACLRQVPLQQAATYPRSRLLLKVSMFVSGVVVQLWHTLRRRSRLWLLGNMRFGSYRVP